MVCYGVEVRWVIELENMKRFFLGLLLPCALVGGAFVAPLFQFTFDIATFLTVISLIFAILTGFFFAAATSNYLRLQSLISEINAGLVSLFALSKSIDEEASVAVADAIDAYMIADLDYELLGFDMVKSKEFRTLTTAIDRVTAHDERGSALLSTLHEKKEELRAAGFETALTSKTIISPGHWAILIALSVLVIILTLALRDASFASRAFGASICMTIYLVLQLLHAIDSNLFLAQNLAFQDAQKVFLGVEKLPYYPEYALRLGYARPMFARYRVGANRLGEAREIRVVAS